MSHSINEFASWLIAFFFYDEKTHDPLLQIIAIKSKTGKNGNPELDIAIQTMLAPGQQGQEDQESEASLHYYTTY